MAVPYCDLSQKQWAEILLRNSSVQRGGGLIGFRGLPFQRGYGFGSFLRTMIRTVAPVAKKIVKNVAKEGLSSAVQIGSDLLEGRDLKESAKEHTTAVGKRLLKKGLKRAKRRLQKGKGIGHRKKKAKPIKGRKIHIGFGKRKRRKSKKADYLDL